MVRHARRRRRPLRWLLWLPALAVLASALQVAALRWIDPPTSAFMLQRRIEALQQQQSGFELRHRWQPLTRISVQLPLAVVAAEDQRFPQHRGFDVDAIRSALDEHGRGERLRGASTISQQVARNLFLWNGRSWLRKGLEAWYTMLLELLWPKHRILEVYLNVAEFGDGIYGAEAAAGHFFGKPAAALTAPEAALLAAVLPNPGRLSASQPSSYVRSRQAWILGQMRQLGGPGYLPLPD
ncbi:MAG TPA: monofunctional biosynthetic peptidoglycan transglycosylase [Xanthomonadaceae bacterium]|nr:monofunctional biosynthetic peptidoglycan transglycosylase [Xanthomonadaceae bacterium]